MDIVMHAHLLKLPEAAYVAGVTLRDLNRTFEENILPAALYGYDPSGGRMLLAYACPFVTFYFDTAASSRLTADERTRVIGKAWERIQSNGGRKSLDLIGGLLSAQKSALIVEDDFLRVDLRPFFQRVEERLVKLKSAEGTVVRDEGVMGGVPVVRGTRISPYDLAASVAKGIPRARILKAYSELSPETLDLSVIWAQANPWRGRPRRVVDVLPEGSKAGERRVVPR
jgi:uncharacterized protein (DUF433 family)